MPSAINSAGGNFMTGLFGALAEGAEKRHAQEEKSNEQRRQDLWKVIQSPDFSEESKQQAWQDLQKLSNPESKKGIKKLEGLFQKLKPPSKNPMNGNGGLLGTGGVPNQGQAPPQQAPPAQAPPQSDPRLLQGNGGLLGTGQVPGSQPSPAAIQKPPMMASAQIPAQTPPQAVNASKTQAAGQQPSSPLQPPALAGPMTEQQKTQRVLDATKAKNEAEEKAAKDYAATLSPAEGKDFLKRYEEQRRFGLKDDKPATSKVIKGTTRPGDEYKGKSFTQVIHPDGNTDWIEEAPKAEKKATGELGQREEAEKVLAESQNPALRKAATDFLKTLDDKQKNLEAPKLTGELKQRMDAQRILATSKDPGEIKAAGDTLKSMAQKAVEAQARIASASGSGGAISDDDLKTLAESNAITGQKTELSYRDPAMKAKYEHYYAEAIRNAGGPQAVSEVQAQYKASRGNLENLEKIQGQMKAAQAGTVAEIDRLVDLSRKVPRSQAKLFNNYAELIQADLTDYPELASYREALVAARDRYTSMIGTFKGGMASTNQMKTETAEEILNRDMPQGALEAAAREMKVGIQNVMKGLDDVIAQTQKDMKTPVFGNPSPNGPPAKVKVWDPASQTFKDQ